MAKHLELHGNNAQQSLRAVSSIGTPQANLRSMAGPDIDATLTIIGGSWLPNRFAINSTVSSMYKLQATTTPTGRIDWVGAQEFSKTQNRVA